MSSSAISASASEQYNSRGREAASSLFILARSKKTARAKSGREAEGFPVQCRWLSVTAAPTQTPASWAFESS